MDGKEIREIAIKLSLDLEKASWDAMEKFDGFRLEDMPLDRQEKISARRKVEEMAWLPIIEAALSAIDPEAIKRACRKGCPECEDGLFDLISDTGIGFCKICGGIAQIPQAAAILQSSPADQGAEQDEGKPEGKQ